MNRNKEIDRLMEQGYNRNEFIKNPKAKWLTRWTPFACVMFSTIGLLSSSPLYFLLLAVLMLTGVFTSRSFYDLIYTYLLSPVLKWGKIPMHSWHRKVGCAMGALIYSNAALQLFTGNFYAAVIPVVSLMIIAFYAGVFNWCFVTVISRLFRAKQAVTCCSEQVQH